MSDGSFVSSRPDVSERVDVGELAVSGSAANFSASEPERATRSETSEAKDHALLAADAALRWIALSYPKVIREMPYAMQRELRDSSEELRRLG